MLDISITKAASELAAIGLPLFPLEPKTKEPARGCMWRDVPVGAYNSAALANGYGVALRACDLVIDVDPRNFLEGDKPHVRLFKDCGISLAAGATFIVKTGSGGLHIYTRKPANFPTRKSLKDKYRGIDFLSDGSYVVGPGSTHPETGMPYVIVSGSPTEIMDAPQALLDVLKKPEVSENMGTANQIKEYLDDEQTASRFLHYLEKVAPPAIQGENGDTTTYKVACYGRDLGLSPQKAFELMAAPGLPGHPGWNYRCEPPWTDDELREKVMHAYRYGQSSIGAKAPQADFDKIVRSAEEIAQELKAKEEREQKEISWVLGKDQRPVKCFYNLLNFFKVPQAGIYKVFGYNEFTAAVEFTNPAPWHKGQKPRFPSVTDHDLKLLKAHLAIKHNFEVKINDLDEALAVIGHANRFHPVREYLLGLTWDGKKRLDHWLTKYGHAKDTAYVRACARKTICAAVARALKPGCKFDHLLVLEGKQGIGKSQLCKVLGGEWYADFTVDPHSKDTVAALQGKWIIEMSEMEITRRADVNALKAFISREIDKVRPAYGRITQEYPRQGVFIGTINPEADGTYLKDTTGNRRFWPVSLGGAHVDIKGLRENRNQIFAEAIAALRAGETLYFDNVQVDAEAQAEAAERHADNPWVERVADWLDMPRQDGTKRTFVTSRDIFIEALGGTDLRLDRRASQAIAEVMRTLKWERVTSKDREHSRFMRGYKRPILDKRVEDLKEDIEL